VSPRFYVFWQNERTFFLCGLSRRYINSFRFVSGRHTGQHTTSLKPLLPLALNCGLYRPNPPRSSRPRCPAERSSVFTGLARRLLGFRRQYGADEFYESSGNYEEQAKKVKPGCVQPMIKGGANQPARHGCGRKRKSELAVPRNLKPEASFLRSVVLVWQASLGPSGRSPP